MEFKTLKDVNLQGKTIILRGDLNVPCQNGVVTDTTRINRLFPTIKYLVDHHARILILSHFGRPEGQKNKKFSLQFLTDTLSKCWGYKVAFADDCIGQSAIKLSHALKDGEIGLLENTRFHAEEETNDPNFAQQLAALGDIYVNDAFSSAHRAHASTEAIAHFLPTYAGFLMETELDALSSALSTPKRPLVSVVGGAKISTKLELLENLVNISEYLILGGGMANTFLCAQDIDVQSSLCEHDMVPQAIKIMEIACASGCEIVLPVDALVSSKLANNLEPSLCDVHNIPDGCMMLDIGLQTIEMLKAIVQTCATLIWNGPLGAFEYPPFDQGTNALAQHVAQLTQQKAILSVAGGGDTVSALTHAGATEHFSYVSTAGGAFLEWLEGKSLPGISALSAYQNAA